MPWQFLASGRCWQPARLRPRVELHLAGCADCRAEIEAARQLDVALHRLPMLEFPQQRLEAVFAEVRRDEELHAIAPAVIQAKEEGINAIGPLPPDTVAP